MCFYHFYALRYLDFFETAYSEARFWNYFQALWKYHRFQFWTVIECIFVNFSNAVGNLNLGETAPSKTLLSYALQAIWKLECFQIFTEIKHSLLYFFQL